MNGICIPRRNGSTHDQDWSDRHRSWGALTASDLDWIEIYHGKAIAMIEGKYGHDQIPVLTGKGTEVIRGQIDLADRANVPLFWVTRDDLWTFNIYAISAASRRLFVSTKILGLTEHRFIAFLHWLRGITCPRLPT